MTSNDALSSNWGEQRVARRNRRRGIIAGAVGVIGIAFVFGGRYIKALGDYIAPVGEGADAGSLVWAAGLLSAMGILVWLGWREMDEMKRRIVINGVAVAGVTAMVLLLLAHAAGRMLPIAEPMLAIWMTAMLVMLAAIVFQRIRG
jgi:uncharacterized membrane protein